MRGRSAERVPNWLIGVLLIVVLTVGSYLAFTKNVPWGGGTEVTAVFRSAQNLRPNSPVRIAGVEVGKVTSVEPLADSEDSGGVGSTGATANGSGAVVKMEIDDEGLPLKEDARFELKPRLFLEGNLFVNVSPGSPSAPVADGDYVFPPQQTSNTVQLDQVLTDSFQADSRRQLQVLLDQFGNALTKYDGAESLRVLNKTAPGAFKYTSQVNQALLGENPHDLSSLIFNLNRVVRGLNGNDQALADLITNLRITTGSFAAQDDSLERAIAELPRTLEAGNRAFASLNSAFPPTRAFAREILPGVRTAPATLDAATPLLAQLRGLAQPAELRGLVSDLRPTVPDLARLTTNTIPFMEQTRALSSCFNHTILPWADDQVDGGAGLQRGSRPERQRLRGDRLRARRDQRREPLRRRQRPVHPRDRRRRNQHRPVSRPEHRRGPGRRHAVPDRRLDAAVRAEDAVPARRAVREPGPAEPLGGNRPGPAAAGLGARRRGPGGGQPGGAARRRRDADPRGARRSGAGEGRRRSRQGPQAPEAGDEGPLRLLRDLRHG